MKIKYDKRADAMYISFDEKAVSARTEKVSEDILIDYTSAGKLMGIEILGVSEEAHSIPEKYIKQLA